MTEWNLNCKIVCNTPIKWYVSPYKQGVYSNKEEKDIFNRVQTFLFFNCKTKFDNSEKVEERSLCLPWWNMCYGPEDFRTNWMKAHKLILCQFYYIVQSVWTSLSCTPSNEWSTNELTITLF